MHITRPGSNRLVTYNLLLTLTVYNIVYRPTHHFTGAKYILQGRMISELSYSRILPAASRSQTLLTYRQKRHQFRVEGSLYNQSAPGADSF